MSAAGTDIVRENIVTLHALTHLLIKKGIVTRAEYETTCDWFKERFDRIAVIARIAAYQNPKPTAVPEELVTLMNEIQCKLFEGP